MTLFSASNSTFVSIRSYGDLVICVSSLCQLPLKFRKNISLIICSHLEELYLQLDSDLTVFNLNVGNKNVPALFDLKQQGILALLKSATLLRGQLFKIFPGCDARLVYDRITWRERLISNRFHISSLSVESTNIYSAYNKFFEDNYDFVPDLYSYIYRGAGIGIFPGSRVHSKNIPISVINDIFFRYGHLGFDIRVFIFEGEELDASVKFPVIKIPKNFSSLMATLNSLAAVVSADSLPAHLSYYLNKPIFVLMPRANLYWLPLSSFVYGYWALFHSFKFSNESFENFLYSIK